MSVIIRLQNLPWTANALDIRRFFTGLHIPDGGVHIVGGDKGDAFIAFATDDDARQAMLMDGGRLSDCNVKLYLSSKTEMQNVIAAARGGPATPADDSSAYGRPNVGGQNAPPIGGNLMGQQQGFGNITSDFNSQSRQGQSSYNSGAGSGSQYARGSEGMGGSYGDNRNQNRMGSYGSQTQSSGTSTSQGYQSGQSSWDRPMQQNLSSSGSDFGGNMGMQQQNQMGGFGGRDSNYSGRDGNRDSYGGGGLNQYSSGSDLGRQSSGYGGSSMSGSLRGGLSNYGRDNQSNLSGNMNTSLGGGLGNIGSSSGFGGRDSKNDSFVERPNEETNIFLQPRDQVRPQTGNIFLQGRDQNRSSSMGGSGRNFDSSSSGGNFGSGGNRFSDNSSRNQGNRYGDNSFQNNRPIQDMGNQRGFGSDNRSGFGSENRGGFPSDNRGGFGNDNRGNFGQDNRGGFNADNRGGFNADNRGDFNADNRRDERRGGMDRRRDGDVTILITDMPIKTSYRDLRRFFGNSSEIIRDGVKLINDKYGQRIGRAYVKFASEQDCRNALRRNGDMIDGKRVNIQKVSAVEYDKAIDSYQPPPDARRPPERREISRDNRDMFNRPPSPKRERAPSPKAPAFSQKPKPRDEPKSKTPVKKEVSPKPKPKPKAESTPKVKAEPAPKNQSPTKRAAARSRSSSPPRKKQATESGENCCILLKNLPFKAQKPEIKKFFGNLKIAARGGPYFEVRNDGKHTGTAFVQFETSREAKEAMKNDGKPLNGRSVEMVPISKREFEENVSSLRSDTPEPEEKPEKVQNGSDKKEDSDQKFYCIKMKGLPYSANNQSVREFFEGLEIANRGIHVVFNSQRQAAGTAFVEFVTARDCKKAQDKHKSHMGKRYILIEAITKREMLEQLQREQQRQREQGPQAPPSLMESINFLSNLGNNIGGGNMNVGGNVNMGNNMGGRGNMGGGDGNRGRLTPFMVQLQNLPFKATESEILAFFRGYGPVRTSLKIDERDGRPSGKAVIGFHNRDQQQRALNELNKKQLMGRPIHIHPNERY